MTNNSNNNQQDMISDDIENNYIRQNLPIRRQSLVAYHDRTRSAPKRTPSLDETTEKLHISTRLHCKSFNSTVHVESEEANNNNNNNNNNNKPTTNVKFIGLLRPSKSDSTSINNKNKKESTTTSLSQSWNDMSQPLLKLKNVLYRLHPNNHENHEQQQQQQQQLQQPRKKKQLKKQNNAGITCCTALLSHVSKALLKKIQISTIVCKDGIEYQNVFSGTTAVNCILDILNTNDRNLAILVGRALESQGLFHHVNYECKLRDLIDELYRFQYKHYDDDPTFNYTQRPPIHPTTTKSKKALAPSVSACETLPVNGIFSILTDCYSPTCTRKSPCYSISCPRRSIVPNKSKNKEKSVKRPLSTFLLRTEQEELRSLWRHSVPLNIVLGTNCMEQKRQECIYELIYTEQDFTRDMQYVQDFWIDPIRSNDIIPIERRNEFITDVFWNLADIRRITSALTKDLTAKQDKHTIIPAVGDILLNHVKEFQPFVTYGEHQIIGKHAYELEKKRNPKFQQFATKLERQPESRRLELNGYLTKPTSRLGRYNLLLNTIHQITPKDHQDYLDIPQVILKITKLLVQLNKKVGLSDNAFQLEQISSKILPTKGGNMDLNLLDSHRQLIMCGKMKRSNNSSWDIQVFLFDHYLVCCKIKYQDGLEYYKMYQKLKNFMFLYQTRI
ncbi:Dbl homology domain-containing protein [Pilaira anomala]|nr:Dbl homology domain-containing protein [Pilaira anomala]